MLWLRQLYEDYPRRALLLVVVVAVVLLMVATGPVATVSAATDPCGTAPDWWTTDYWTWLSCEVTTNGATYTVSEITSPVLNTIDSDLQSLGGQLGSINGALAPLAGMTGSITGAISNVTAFFTPSSADASGLAAQIQAVAQQNSALAYAVTLTSAVQAVQTAVDGVSAGTATVDTSHDSVLSGAPVTYTDVYGGSHSIALGPLGQGISWFLYGLDRLGWHPAQFRQFFDAWWFVVVVIAILRDLGVHVGVVPRAVSEHASFFDGRKEKDDS